jgi:hypothetical protein
VRFRRPLRPEGEFEVLVKRTDAVDELRFEVRAGNATVAQHDAYSTIEKGKPAKKKG